jgi:exportin-1
MENILNFSEPLDVAALDRVVDVFYRGGGNEQQMAQKLLTQFQEHPDAWTRVDYILEYSSNTTTKYIGLQILEKLIQTRWKLLPKDQRDGINNYIVSLIIKKSQDETHFHKERTYVNKLNLILVQILKQEWPQNWPTFIPELIGASKTNETLCENNMKILKLLSEEIFDYSAEQMVQEKVKNLKNQLCQEFSDISQLCSFVLANATKPSLILATLDTLLKFLIWIPLGYIFETDLIKILVTRVS